MAAKNYIDILWTVLLAVFLFGAGVVYQWFADSHPIYPLTIPGNVLDSSTAQVANTLQRVGLKKPSYYYETEFTEDSTWHDPTAAETGLTLVTAVNADQILEARVLELDGMPVQTWSIDWFPLWPNADHVPDIFMPKQQPGTHIHGAVIMGNGDLVFNFEYQGMMRLDVCGDVVWRLPYQTHHSIDVDERTGNLWASGRIFHDKVDPRFPNHMPTFAEPTVLEVSPEGEILKEISIIELLQKNDLHGLLHIGNFGGIQRGSATTTGDTLHLNDVEVFPPTLKAGRFKPGDLMVSLRNIHTVLVFDPDTDEIIYRQSGGFVGQHDPDFIDGDRISVFDNAVAIGEDAARESRVVILSGADAFAEPEVYFKGSEASPFYTDVMGKHQWLPNGNLLLTESTNGRAFEIDSHGEIVWQHVNLVDDGGWVGLVDEAQRLPRRYDRAFFEDQRRQRCGGPQRIAARGRQTRS